MPMIQVTRYDDQTEDRFHCTPEDPWTNEKCPTRDEDGKRIRGPRVQHTGAHETADYGDSREMTCKDCGTRWEEELPQ